MLLDSNCKSYQRRCHHFGAVHCRIRLVHCLKQAFTVKKFNFINKKASRVTLKKIKNMEKFSLSVISVALLLLGIWEVVTWPQWALSDSPLFILLGRSFRQIYALTELTSATAFAIFGLFGLYFAAVGSSQSHKLTGRFEVWILLPLLVLYFSAVGFVILGAELMAHNRLLSMLAGRLWRWRFQHSDHATLLSIEDLYQCCGWSKSHKYALSRFCHTNPIASISSCSPFILNHSGEHIYRQGLLILLYTFPLLLLAVLVIYSHKADPVAADVEEAETLNDRRKQLYTGNAPAIQLQLQ